jgi:hypothetical protein
MLAPSMAHLLSYLVLSSLLLLYTGYSNWTFHLSLILLLSLEKRQNKFTREQSKNHPYMPINLSSLFLLASPGFELKFEGECKMER